MIHFVTPIIFLWNPSQPYIVIYQYLNRGHNIMEKGRKSATMISYYIQYIYDRTFAMRHDPELQSRIRELDE